MVQSKRTRRCDNKRRYPYCYPDNAQVILLGESIEDIQIGSVDKFQGQEAAVVIISMAASSAEEAPRGMEFLYSLNRLNVAACRARCATFLVASPRLAFPECHSPKQMRLANGIARFLELATTVDL
jgi:superfamily I DNA and/or RNA helicase